MRIYGLKFDYILLPNHSPIIFNKYSSNNNALEFIQIKIKNNENDYNKNTALISDENLIN